MTQNRNTAEVLKRLKTELESGETSLQGFKQIVEGDPQDTIRVSERNVLFDPPLPVFMHGAGVVCKSFCRMI